jgi:hypothetical protein
MCSFEGPPGLLFTGVRCKFAAPNRSHRDPMAGTRRDAPESGVNRACFPFARDSPIATVQARAEASRLRPAGRRFENRNLPAGRGGRPTARIAISATHACDRGRHGRCNVEAAVRGSQPESGGTGMG